MKEIYFFFKKIHDLSDIDSTAAKAQQLPQADWSRIIFIVAHSGHFTIELK